jgi:hypothetical protein
MEVSLFEIQKEIISLGGKCISCKKEFEHGDIDWYEHDGGREVRESPAKLWIFFHCQKCQYDSALWKIEQQLEIEEEYKLEVLAAQRQAQKELWNNKEDEAWMDAEGIDKDLQRLVEIAKDGLTDKEVEEKLIKEEDE